MSLLDYAAKFSSLRMNPRGTGGRTNGGDEGGDRKSPHKVALLLGVIDLIENKEVSENRIYFDQKLLNIFTKYFNRLAADRDRNNPHLPFFHLRSSGFWHHQVKPGRRDQYSALTTASGPGAINDNIAYAYLDDELFELLSFSTARDALSANLYENLSPIDQRRILQQEGGWDWLECEAIVQNYFEMLLLELSGISYSKTEHRRLLKVKLNNRTDGSIEYKHQNISAVLIEMGQPYIQGYKPAFNYQSQLKSVVTAYLAAHSGDYDAILDSGEFSTRKLVEEVDWAGVFDEERPERIGSVRQPERKFIARRLNFSEREARNRKLGELGEEFVLEFEKFRLTKAGREDLAKEVEWSSRERGDGLGYDIRSFSPLLEEERFIEVKTTNSGKFQSFYISDNELAFSKEHAPQYSLYRVYDFRKRARIFSLPGEITKHVHVSAQSFLASFS